MFRVGTWLSGKRLGSNASTPSIDVSTDLRDLEDAMQSASLILNDDVDGAESGLAEGDSTFHKLGKGVVAFVRATLGFEQEVMRQASERLTEAESGAASDQSRAQSRSPHASRSEIYAPGTEYVLCQAMAQLMGAVVGVLNESLTESIRGFYKMRKAYLALDSILQMEEKFIQERESRLSYSIQSSVSSQTMISSAGETVMTTTSSLTQVQSFEISSEESPDPDSSEFQTPPTEPLEGSELSEKLADLAVGDADADTPTSTGNSSPSVAAMFNYDPNSDVFKNKMDVFIHSGANCCYGVLLLLISMIPPAFGKLLGIIGFRGDKQKGLRMLWQATKFHNMMGAIAGFALLGYYNGFVRYCDIMADVGPGEDPELAGYPRDRLTALLTEMRERYPDSQLWILEEARMKAANKNLKGALEMLTTDVHSPLKQVEALKYFEKSLNSMYLHEYELCAKSFMKCGELNNWSLALYNYIVGAAHLALYRQLNKTDPTTASKHAEKATKYFRLAPTTAGKKRFMARQLPFDRFVTRKVAKWEARSKEWKVPLVDAVGVDPVEEMIFFWNGHSRMTKEQLEESLSKLAWCESDANPQWALGGIEEQAILDLLRAAVYRSLRRHDEAKEILQHRVMNHDKSLFKGNLKDDWILPVAHFEMAANLWMERPTYIAAHGPSVKPPSSSDSNSSTSTIEEMDSSLEKRKVRECKEHIDQAAKWESYEMEARVGIKVTSALDAIQKWEAIHSTVGSSQNLSK
ncbi:hypothetical protein ASPZODRAFT_128173 [Penicilliopsis zonata CBS 506.65]|uniref:Inclusion body clearance protein IML2 n=1 Tax=Penicilliopsis zonata CBS 506.65 TaxID=1073090 RepID=A0A1L9SRC9_9EURO|nr:hypothetical protein ASPZODRAFT_128173 [Penicilliopsis zonata CBS 506.65]OJJ49674.1 hypothetical protein ASPZODRAFT_128173 [Penicilliopsis zonata CBS 506.65]